MALPPLELFSLKKRPPCCRAAFSRVLAFVRARFWNGKLMDGCDLVDSRDVVEFRRGDRSMHDFFVALIFVALIMAPCLVAFKTKRNDVDSK